jgi:hypothetical protein
MEQSSEMCAPISIPNVRTTFESEALLDVLQAVLGDRNGVQDALLSATTADVPLLSFRCHVHVLDFASALPGVSCQLTREGAKGVNRLLRDYFRVAANLPGSRPLHTGEEESEHTRQ